MFTGINKYLIILLVILIGSIGVLTRAYFKERESRIRMTDNYNVSSDSIKVIQLKNSEIREAKKQQKDRYLQKIDSLQKKYNIKNRHLNEAESIILRYKNAEKKTVLPKIDTLYIKGNDSIIYKEPVLQGNYQYNDGCIFFDAKMIFNKKMEMEVLNSGFDADIEIIDYTRRRRSWLFGLRIGRKENKIIANTDCGKLNVTKYKKVK